VSRHVTAEFPPAGGTVKARPEDFVVEEVPAYAPSGEGEHLYLWIEKIGHDTPWVAKAIARVAGVDPREVGYAGLKDRHAVTRQLFSVPAKAEPALAGFSAEGVRVLWTKRHGNKLRTGHLVGNRFTLRLRDVRDVDAGLAAFQALVERGVANRFGEQRFGRDDNAAAGKLLIRGERLPKRPERFERKLFLSAYQSALFNALLDARLEDGTWARALAGDVLRKSDTGGLFVCEAPEIDQPRVDRFEVSPAGPMFGPKMPRAKGEVAAREEALLASEGLTLEDFRRGGDETEGTRRAYRVRLEEPSATRDGGDLLLSFVLPKGSYATVVLDELVKP
jgi:tRNA pseudouridine13 synthase